MWRSLTLLGLSSCLGLASCAGVFTPDTPPLPDASAPWRTYTGLSDLTTQVPTPQLIRVGGNVLQDGVAILWHPDFWGYGSAPDTLRLTRISRTAEPAPAPAAPTGNDAARILHAVDDAVARARSAPSPAP